MIRTGSGFDVHRFSAERKLILCGVEIPGTDGLDGHSDADVAVHALIDALLGALALGDIGMLFPDTDEKYRGADSMKLLKHVIELEAFESWRICNVDITIVAQAPKLSPYRDEMRKCLSSILALDIDRVSVKFTTTEKLGFTGRKEGIASMASVLICRK